MSPWIYKFTFRIFLFFYARIVPKFGQPLYKYFSLKVLLFQSRSMNNTTHCWRYAFSLSIVLTVFDFVWFEKENIVCRHKWQRKVVNLVFMEQYTSKLTKQCKCEKRNISPHNVLRKHVMYNNYNLKQKTFFSEERDCALCSHNQPHQF